MRRHARRILVATLSAATLTAVGVAPAGAVTFTSPSGNIGCALTAKYVRCDIGVRFWEPPPKPASCPVDWGNGLGLTRRGRARFVCAGDTLLGSGPALAYGRSIRRGRFRCVSRRKGMRCLNRRNGHGFALSRQAARRF